MTFKVKSRKLLLLVSWLCYLTTVQEEWFKVNQIRFGNFSSVFHWIKIMKYLFKSLLNTEACAFCNQFKRFLRSYVAQNYECNIDTILHIYQLHMLQMFSSQIKIISTTSPFMEQTQDSFFKKMLVMFSHVFIT